MPEARLQRTRANYQPIRGGVPVACEQCGRVVAERRPESTFSVVKCIDCYSREQRTGEAAV
jgi:ribosomal protein S27E